MPSALKRKILLLLLLFGAALVLVAAGLPRLNLRPGMPQPYFSEGQIFVQNGAQGPPVNYEASSFVLRVLAAAAAVGLVWILYRAMRGMGWRELLRQLLKFAVAFGIFAAVLVLAVVLMPTAPPPAPVDISLPPPLPPVTAPLGAPPPGLVWLVGIALAAGAALVAAWFFRSRPRPYLAMERLGEEADKARLALLTGMSLREVILECYRQMSRVLEEENGIERQSSMTTGDFERLLAAQGFPNEPVHRLTRLFDAVRYGRWQPGPDDEQKAIDCLEAITRCSKEKREEQSVHE